MEQLSEIQKFYYGSTIFLTGATGFIGKLVLEKILRSCPGIRHVYILVRVKKGKDQNERLLELFECPTFDNLKRNYREFAQKITIVNGDLAEPDCGLSETDKKVIVEDVDIVIHCAATVRFDQILSQAVRINVRGTRDILRIAHQMNHLKAFVYVSTAFSNCDNTFIDEIIYKPKIDGEDLIQAVEALPDDHITDLTKRLMGELPNTYILTKQISEGLVRKLGQTLPIIIVRPSIVIAAHKEPLAGFISNVYGPTMLFLSSALGILRSAQMRLDCKADLVPADFVVNHIITAAWYIGNNRVQKQSKDPEVMNYVSSVHNPKTWGQFIVLLKEIGPNYASTKIMFYPTIVLQSCKYLHRILDVMFHMIPAYIVDYVIKLKGGEPMFVTTYQKVRNAAEVITYFPMREWDFSDFNTRKLLDAMSPEDKSIFNFDIKALDWVDYMHSYIKGIRVYILKDPLDTIEAGKRHMRKLEIIFYTIVGALVFLFLSLLYLYLF